MVRRRPGTGAIFRSKARDRWVAQVSLPGPPRRFVTRWCRSKDDARIALAQLLDEYAIAPAPDARLPLREYAEGWFRTSGAHLAPESKRAYRFRLEPFLRTLGTVPLGRLRVSDVDRVMALQQGAGASPRAISASVVVLGIILNSAVRDGAIGRNVARDARKPRVTRPEIRAMSLAEARAILDATAPDATIGPIIALLLGSGLRIGEALALDWGDIDFAEGTVRVRGARRRDPVAWPRSRPPRSKPCARPASSRARCSRSAPTASGCGSLGSWSRPTSRRAISTSCATAMRRCCSRRARTCGSSPTSSGTRSPP